MCIEYNSPHLDTASFLTQPIYGISIPTCYRNAYYLRTQFTNSLSLSLSHVVCVQLYWRKSILSWSPQLG